MNRQKVVDKINSLKGEEGHKWIVETYNSIKPLPRGYKLKMSDAWCAGTVSAVLHSFGYDDLAECSCPKMIDKAKAKGIWVENDAFVPQIGDIIMYDWQDSGKGDNVGNPDHVGIVVSVNKNKIMVREGNKNKTIGNRDVTVNSVTIRGYITPPYEAVGGVSTQKEENPNTSSPKEEKAKETPQSEVKAPYEVGKVYTISVRSALNVRKGAGKGYAVVGYKNLTPDGRKHAIPSSGALRNGTRVTVQEVRVISSTDVWVRIPSGWICAIDGNKKFVV